jgi:plastocyanin
MSATAARAAIASEARAVSLRPGQTRRLTVTLAAGRSHPELLLRAGHAEDEGRRAVRSTKGGRYAYRFNRTETFAYLCAIHPAMKGRVVVSRP